MGSPKLHVVVLLLLLAAACGKSKEGKHEDRNDPATAPAQLTVHVTIAGAASTWGPDAFAAVPHHATAATSGEARDVWSLRDLVHERVGPTARVISVTGPEGTKLIDVAAWNDAMQTPVIHTTRRGTLKFRFEDAAGKWGPSLVNDVSALEIVR